MQEIKKNTPYTGTIEKTVFGGKGIIKIDDFIIFIKNGIEGQVVEYEITKKKKNYAEGSIINIQKHSPLEIPFSEQKNPLPGCAYQNIVYKEQIELKTRQISEIFRNFPHAQIPSVLPSPKVFSYRNKMEFSIGYESMTSEYIDGKKVWTDTGVAVGFHPPKSWAKVISIPDAFIASSSTNLLRAKFEEYLRMSVDNKRHPWNPLISKGFWRGIIIRESEYTGDICINIVVSRSEKYHFYRPLVEMFLSLDLPEKKQISGILQVVHSGKNDAIVSPEISILWGDDILVEKLGEKQFEISPFSFFQTNTSGAEVLYSTIKKYLGSTKGKTVLDLFCGTGAIGIFCADDAKKVIGIELVEEAVEMAQKNAERNNLTNTEFIAGKAEKTLPDILDQHEFETVIIDPPRAGMHPKALEIVSELQIDKLVYVSCNPTTLARDAHILEQSHWKLVEVQGIDMFPHTPHVECVSIFERKILS